MSKEEDRGKSRLMGLSKRTKYQVTEKEQGGRRERKIEVLGRRTENVAVGKKAEDAEGDRDRQSLKTEAGPSKMQIPV